MEKYVRVPVVDVHKDNIRDVWSGLVEGIRGASFIALDTELSGLGDRKKLMAKSIEDRYKNLIEVAKSRAILTLGISCFKESSRTISETGNGNPSVHYKVQTFNLSVLCSQEFVVEPGSLQFLIQHGFDFNKQFSKGIPYYRGMDKELPDFTSFTIRNIFSHILLANKPVILHNGLVDLVFLYQNFYNDLPDKLEVFTSDMFEMFSTGVLDTKYVAEFQLRESASYLGYIFRKCQRQNSSCQESSQAHVSVEFADVQPHAPWIEYLYCNGKPVQSDDSSIQVCDIYAAHGYCRQGVECHLSHDIDHILDKSEKKQCSKRKRKNRKRKASSTGEETIDSKKKENFSEQPTNGKKSTSQNSDSVSTCTNIDNSSIDYQCKNDAQEYGIQDDIPCTTHGQTSHIENNFNKNSAAVSGGHRAGIDGFMTGYCLATYLIQCGVKGLDSSGWLNKISLSGKEVPLTLAQSHFSKPSTIHTQKMKLLKQNIFGKKNDD